MISIIFSMLTDEQQNIVETIFKENDMYFKKIALGILKTEENASDAVSLSYIKIMENIERISQLSCPQMTAFCVTIVKHTSIDFLRRNKKVIVENDRSVYDKTSSYNLEETILIKEKEETLLKHIKTLSEEEQFIIQMRYADEMKYSEIGEILNITEETAKKKGQRIISKLKTIYAEEKYNGI